ncbi:hypothetical protein STENM223S_00887 [Streptomyces tendae]
MTAAERAELPGVSEARAGQLLAGAMVAEGAIDLFGVERLEICPWALREGVVFRTSTTWARPDPAGAAPEGAVARYGKHHNGEAEPAPPAPPVT